MSNKNAKSGGPRIPHWMLLIATLLGVVELALYIRDGRTSFDPNYSVYAIVGMGLGIGFGLLGFISRWRPLAFTAYLAFLYAFIHYVMSQINLIANILYGVDGSTFPPVFFVTLCSAFASCLLALVAGIAMRNRASAPQA